MITQRLDAYADSDVARRIPVPNWAEAVTDLYHLHPNAQPKIEAILRARSAHAGAFAVAELLDYLGLHPSNPHPPPRSAWADRTTDL
jgi:hypothetical protein